MTRLRALAERGPVGLVVAGVLVPLFGERPGVRFRAWSALAAAGAAIVALAGASGPGGEPTGMIFAVRNVAFYAVYFVLSKRGRGPIDVVPFLFGAFLCAAVVVTLYCLTLAHLLGGVLTIAGVAGAILSPAGRRLIAKEEAALVTGSG